MGNELNTPEQVVYVCTGDKCKKRGGKQIAKFYKAYVKEHQLRGKVEVIKTDCTDRCKFGPIVCFQPQNEWHLQVDETKAEALVQEKIIGKKSI